MPSSVLWISKHLYENKSIIIWVLYLLCMYTYKQIYSYIHIIVGKLIEAWIWICEVNTDWWRQSWAHTVPKILCGIWYCGTVLTFARRFSPGNTIGTVFRIIYVINKLFIQSGCFQLISFPEKNESKCFSTIYI